MERHGETNDGSGRRRAPSESDYDLSPHMEHIRNQHGLPLEHPSKGPPTNCETSNAEELSRMAASVLAARIRELEDEACGLRCMVCYLLTKNESLRQQLKYRNEAERAPM
jgi:hypothetical protein